MFRMGFVGDARAAFVGRMLHLLVKPVMVGVEVSLHALHHRIECVYIK